MGLGKWLDTTNPIASNVAADLEDLRAGELSAKRAKPRLLKNYMDGTKASDRLITTVEGAGTPKMDDGRRIAKDYLGTLADLRAAYFDARRDLAKLKTAGDDGFLAEAEKIEAAVFEDFQVIGSPLEELRAVPQLADAIDNEGSCSDVIEFYRGFERIPIAVGECVNETVTEVSPCSEPHFGEVFLVADYAAEENAPFPGDETISAFGDESCLPAFAAYVGIEADLSQLEVTVFQPSADTWFSGDRQIICVVHSPDDSMLVGSVRGTAR